MTFCYFIPDWQQQMVSSVNELPAHTGLAKVLLNKLPGVQTIQACVGAGPNDRLGTFIAASPAAGSGGKEWPSLEYDKTCVVVEGDDEKANLAGERQCWHEVKRDDGTTNYWIGWDKASPPTPADVQRDKLVDGHYVMLGDGNEWLIPVVGPYRSRLPQEFRVNGKGELIADVKRDYRKLLKDSESLRTRWMENGTVLKAEFWMYAASLLEVNYRVGLHEIAGDVLNLVNTDNYVDVFNVSVGLRDIELDEQVKKNGEDGQPGS